MLHELALVPEVGALAQWRAELAAGARTKLIVDPLFLAACDESTARDYLAHGLRSAANEYRTRAANTILAAARKRAVA
jgi:hypothetical protein